MSDRRLLVLERHLPHVQALLDGAGSRWEPVGTSGLLAGLVPQDAYTRLRDGRAAWGPLVAADRELRAAFTGIPDPATVQSTTMDYHGHGAPVPSARRLPPRVGDRQLGEGVLVGVVDTGMRSHPWLDGGYLASPRDFEPYDEHGLPNGVRDHAGHGMFLAGLVLQQAQAAGVWVERALEPVGSGLASAVATAALTLATRGIDVLNLSLGCFDDEPDSHLVMAHLVEQLHVINPDLVVVAAAGNLGGPGDPTEPAPFWPAALPGVLAVGSAQQDDDGQVRWAPWSNRGPWIDLAAPGTDLLSTYLYDQRAIPNQDGAAAVATGPLYRGWARWSGTSLSAAIVSGQIAAAMDEKALSAPQAVTLLRAGQQWPGYATEPEAGVPAVPVVRPVDWYDVLVDDPAAAATAGARLPRPWWGEPPTSRRP